MKYEHKAIIDRANRDGKSPSEIAHELLGHDLLKAMVTAISKPAVAFSKMSEQQQQGVIEDLTKELVPAISTAIGIIVSQNSHAVRMKLKKLATGPSLQLTGSLDKTQDHIHELMDLASDNSDVLVILHERDYLQGLDGIQAEKDQPELPLDDSKPASTSKPRATKKKDEPKAIELPPALIEQAEEFVRGQQNTKVSALQNHLKINFDKGQALLAALEERGVVTAEDEEGNRHLIRAQAAAETATDSGASATETQADDTDGHQLETDANGFVIMSDELVALATTKVRKDGKVSKGALAVTYDLDDTVADQLIDRLELECVISAEDDLGGREVITVQ